MQDLLINKHTIMLPLILTLIAGLSTCIGSLCFLFIKRFKDSSLVFCLGLSAGAMLYISFVELLGIAISSVGFIYANLAFIAGIGTMLLIDLLIPHQYLEEKQGLDNENKSLYSTGVLIAIGIAIHNFPEGMAVFLSSLSNLHLGIGLAVAIAAHNIPEGIAVSIPIYYATKSKGKAFGYSFLSGVAEPIGAIIAIFIIGSTLQATTVAYLFAFVAGIMVFICFDELLPQAFKKDYHMFAISGMLAGMFVMMCSLAV